MQNRAFVAALALAWLASLAGAEVTAQDVPQKADVAVITFARVSGR